MYIEETDALLIRYRNLPELTEEHFEVLVSLADDKDDCVRGQAAALLINFENDISKNVLLRLAQDKDALVRTEAYDSLSVFESEDVERFLEDAMRKEKDHLACSYAILSWADIAVALYDDVSEKILLAEELKKTSRIVRSEHCLLSCSYAQYIFGREEMLDEMLGFLKSSDYHIRCSVISLARDILDDDNETTIKHAIKTLLSEEKSRAVLSSAEKLLREIETVTGT